MDTRSVFNENGDIKLCIDGHCGRFVHVKFYIFLIIIVIDLFYNKNLNINNFNSK